ncbi:MAG: formate dehydrogenase subunit delta [Halieaceae bacterium]
MTINADKLVRMGEQITDNMRYTDDEAVVAAKVAEHLGKFWDPRMQDAIIRYAAQADAELSKTLRAAIALL